MPNTIIKNPSARTIIEGLRSIGYSFSTAVADIVDNSITAEAKEIKIFSDPLFFGQPYFMICDDGIGMSRKKLEDSMQFGADESDCIETEKTLGRFGLGMKTASLSQCRHFSVITKQNGVISGAAWDIDKIIKTDTWVLDILTDEEIASFPIVSDFLSARPSGTVVIWQNFDVLSESTDDFVNSFHERVSEATDYCALVFHRFHDSIKISFNENLIPERDPFLEDSDKKVHGPEFKVIYNGTPIVARAYVMPLVKNLSQKETDLLGGSDTIRSEQGFYIYRNNRLIIWGTWLHMQARSAFTKLGRVKVDVPRSLDKQWGLDVKKSSARIPDALKKSLLVAVNDSVTKSKMVVSDEGASWQKSKDKKVWYPSENSGGIAFRLDRDYPSIKEVFDSLDAKHQYLLSRYLDIVEDRVPKALIANSFNSDKNIVNGSEEIDRATLEADLLSNVKKISCDDAEKAKELLSLFLQYDQYSTLSDEKEALLKKLL